MPPAHGMREKFWARVNKGRPNECWEWASWTSERGYGRFYHQGRYFYAHRLSWYLEHGHDPLDRFVCHKCDNPICVNPRHLFVGTQDDNMADMSKKGRANRTPRVLGAKHPQAKLTPTIVREIDRLRAAGMLWEDIANRFGVSKVTAHRAGTRRTWKHVPGRSPDIGRPKKLSPTDRKRVVEMAKRVPKVRIAKAFGVNRRTIANVLANSGSGRGEA